MKRSRKKSSMSGKDTHGTSWLDGWGKNRKKVTRLERRRRSRTAAREELSCTCSEEQAETLGGRQHAADCPLWGYRGFADGGYIPASAKGADRIPLIFSEGEEYLTAEEVRERYGNTLKTLNVSADGCLFFWGSHGCDLPPDGHTVHECQWSEYDEDGEVVVRVESCCQYDEKRPESARVRWADETGAWREWLPYGDGWYMEPRKP